MPADRAALAEHQKAYKGFLADVETFRPDLHRYCRKLSSSVWDAEDLVQETLLQGCECGRSACMRSPTRPNPGCIRGRLQRP